MMSSIANQCFELDLEYTYKLCCSTTKVNMYIPDPEVQICKVRKPKKKIIIISHHFLKVLSQNKVGDQST